MHTAFADAAIRAVADPKAVILDVRRDEEWAVAHARGAVHWDLAKLTTGQMPDIPKDAHVYVYCAAGARAGEAQGILMANGWTNVLNMGGLNDWATAAGAVER